MALQSKLFRSDSKLEAAAVSDPAHITLGARGDHVRKIQLALIQLDGANIQPDGAYGPATAAAVLAYKRKRNIVNRAYQTTADNIVGKMTVVAMDNELRAREIDPSGNTCILDVPVPPDAGGRRAPSSAVSSSLVAAPSSGSSDAAVHGRGTAVQPAMSAGRARGFDQRFWRVSLIPAARRGSGEDVYLCD